MVIKTAFSQSAKMVEQAVRMWLEGRRGSVQVVQGADDGHESNECSASMYDSLLHPQDNGLVGPIHVSIEL